MKKKLTDIFAVLVLFVVILYLTRMALFLVLGLVGIFIFFIKVGLVMFIGCWAISKLSKVDKHVN